MYLASLPPVLLLDGPTSAVLLFANRIRASPTVGLKITVLRDLHLITPGEDCGEVSKTQNFSPRVGQLVRNRELLDYMGMTKQLGMIPDEAEALGLNIRLSL